MKDVKIKDINIGMIVKAVNIINTTNLWFKNVEFFFFHLSNNT